MLDYYICIQTILLECILHFQYYHFTVVFWNAIMYDCCLLFQLVQAFSTVSSESYFGSLEEEFATKQDSKSDRGARER